MFNVDNVDNVVDDDNFVADNVPALSSDVLMAAVVKLLPFTPDPLVPKLGVQVLHSRKTFFDFNK